MQAVDLYVLSLGEFVKKSGKPLARETSRKPRTDITDALRTVYWFRCIERRTGITTSTGLEKRFEPQLATGPKYSDESKKNKWGKYRAGKHVPSKDLQQVVEAAIPGLSRQLNHPLWDLLAEKAVDVDITLRLLDTPMRDRLLRTKQEVDGKNVRTKPIDKVLANALLRAASLDTLAAVILLFKRGVHERDDNEALGWSREIYRQLVVLGEHLMCHSVALALFELIVHRIIDPHPINGQRYYFSIFYYLPAIEKLADTMHHLKDHPFAEMTASEKKIQTVRVMDGTFGWDCKFAFNPFLVGSNVPIDYQRRDYWLFLWAWNMLDSGGHPGFPPKPVIDGSNLHARDQRDVNMS